MKGEGAGRPKAIIDWNEVAAMLEAGATAEGIAATLGISVDTLYVRCKRDNKQDFSAYRQQKHAKGNVLLNTKQFGVAMSGNVAMLIWLGKQRLNQSETHKHQIGGDPDGVPIQTQRADLTNDERAERARAYLADYERFKNKEGGAA